MVDPVYPDLQRFSRSFYERSPLEVAADLVGAHLVLQAPEGILALRLVELEAYLGPGEDPASHAFRGSSSRNREMFETPGCLYMYMIYGIHHCMNVVCHRPQEAGAVLIRAAEPVLGETILHRRRDRRGPELCNGPAKLAAAMGLDLRWRGSDLTQDALGIWPGNPPERLSRSGRIGISQATERPYRFFDGESSYLSRGKPASATSGK